MKKARREVKRRGRLAAIPFLPNGLADVERLRAAPLFNVGAFDALTAEARALRPLPPSEDQAPAVTRPTIRTRRAEARFHFSDRFFA